MGYELFFCVAHRFRCAAAIFARAAAESFRRLEGFVEEETDEEFLGGRPRRLADGESALRVARAWRACCNFTISASIWAIRAAVFMQK